MKIPTYFKKYLLSRKWIYHTAMWKNHLIASGYIIPASRVKEELDKAPELINENIKNAIRKPIIGIVKEQNFSSPDFVYTRASWLRYERFCKSNDVEYKFIDIMRSDWIEQCDKVDIVLWHTASSPSIQHIAESKIYILEKEMNKTCFPSFHEVWQYEDKIRANYLYELHNIQSIPTFTTNDYAEAVNKIKEFDYPVISKIDTGSGSKGVEKIKSPKIAKRIINKIFQNGRNCYWQYVKQKDYIYFQQFISDATYDLRIMIVDNKAFGYFRYPQKGDFKASGSGIVIKKEIPLDAILMAIEIKNKLKCQQLGIDLLYSEKAKKYYVIETSTFNQIDTPRQLEINGIAGYYDISDQKNITFKEGEFWIQELALNDIIETWLLK